METKIGKTISTKEAMEIVMYNNLGTITKVTLITWLKKNNLGRKVGGRWRINEDKFMKFLSSGGKS